MTYVIHQNRVSLRNLKIADFASEETLCFSATVLLDGQPIAEARNDGHHPCRALTRGGVFFGSVTCSRSGGNESHGDRM